MYVLVADDHGYFGAVLVPFLRATGYEVDGLDLGMHGGCDLKPGREGINVRVPARHLGRRNRSAGRLRRCARARGSSMAAPLTPLRSQLRA
jgi:nucleoside-diphosphate-sugar epimerase